MIQCAANYGHAAGQLGVDYLVKNTIHAQADCIPMYHTLLGVALSEPQQWPRTSLTLWGSWQGARSSGRQLCDRRGHRAGVRAPAHCVRELLRRQGSPGAGAADCLTNLACL